MIISYVGHASFILDGSKKIIIDPYIGSDSKASLVYDHCNFDAILVTHGHNDHLGDAEKISELSGAPIVTMVELANILAEKGSKAIGFNFGGTWHSDGLSVKMTPAWHSSSVKYQGQTVYAGPAAGFIIRTDGYCFYHAGDTSLFYDMAAVIEREKIDVAFLPIGDYYTMGVDDAVTAAKWLKAKMVIPMHFNTFPVIAQDADLFAETIARNTESRCVIMKPGEKFSL